MQKTNNTIAIIGAGIAGVATAYYLLKKQSDLKVILIDKNQPLSYTTSKSGENFRDFWPQKPMTEFSSHSIELMKELRSEYGEDAFSMNFSGYDFVSFDVDKPIFPTNSQEVFDNVIEEITERETIGSEHPYLSKKIRKIVRIKNAGNIDVYGMGMLMLSKARKLGLQLLTGEVSNIHQNKSDFEIILNNNKKINANKIVIAAGPFMGQLAKMLDMELPVENILQQKFMMPDPQKIIPTDMAFTIYADSQSLDWSEEERALFAADEKYKWLLHEFPGGLHIKPESGKIKLGWAFNTSTAQPVWEPTTLELFPQVVLKGASRFIPQLADYQNNIPSPIIQYAGYYTRTKENFPLIGATQMSDVFLVGALAGFGTMSACAAGELCAKYVLNETNLPDYARYFHPLRYADSELMNEINHSMSDGQL